MLGLIYGISRQENGDDTGGIPAILVGLAAGAAFVIRELRTPDPAVDLRIFRSRQFNTAVTADMTFRLRHHLHTIGLVMAAVPIAAIVAAMVPIKVERR